jgi:phage terminase large subunit
VSICVGRYIDDPVLFCREVLKAEPDGVQKEILRSVAAGPRVSVRSGHGVGKTAALAWLLIWFLCTRPYPKIPCTAPTKHQLYDILWAEVAKWLRRGGLSGEIVWTYDKVYMKGHREDWFAVPRTATAPDALQGFHAEHMLYLIDEASGVADEVFEPVLGALSTKNAKLVLCGNPTRGSGFFYDSHHKNRGMFHCFAVSSEHSPRVEKGYPELIAGMYGKDSDAYRVRVLGEFPKAAPDSFISLEWLEKAATRQMPKRAEYTVDIGVDVARFGDDESVISAVFDERYALGQEVHRKYDTMALSGRVAQIVQQYRREMPEVLIRVKVDCDGLGAGTYDRLKELSLPCALFECHFGGRGGRLRGEPLMMANAAALMWGRLRRMLMEGELFIYPDNTLMGQLSDRKYKILSDGKIALEKKDEMKARGSKSPDRADALALALYTPGAGQFVTLGSAVR